MKRRGFLKMFGAAAVAAAVPQTYADGGPFKPIAAIPLYSLDNDVGIGPLGVALADGQAGDIIPMAITAGRQSCTVFTAKGQKLFELRPGETRMIKSVHG